MLLSTGLIRLLLPPAFICSPLPLVFLAFHQRLLLHFRLLPGIRQSGVEPGEVLPGWRPASVGSGLVPGQRSVEILSDPRSVFVHDAQFVLRHHEAAVRRCTHQNKCLVYILLDTVPFEVNQP